MRNDLQASFRGHLLGQLHPRKRRGDEQLPDLQGSQGCNKKGEWPLGEKSSREMSSKKVPKVVFGSMDVNVVYDWETSDYRTTKGHKAATRRGSGHWGKIIQGDVIQESAKTCIWQHGCQCCVRWGNKRLPDLQGSQGCNKKGEWPLVEKSSREMSSKKVPKVVFGSMDVIDMYDGETGDYRTTCRIVAGERLLGEVPSIQESAKSCIW